MIVVSFFSAKGGTGKTTFNMSMASFLKYHLGKAVIMLDADTPEYNLYNSRVRELDYKRANGGIDESALYPVWKVLDVTPEGIENLAGKLDALRGSVDYVLIDFPGSLRPEGRAGSGGHPRGHGPNGIGIGPSARRNLLPHRAESAPVFQ